LPFGAVRRPPAEFGPPKRSRFSRVSGIGCMVVVEDVAATFCPDSVAAAGAPASFPLVGALGAVAPVSAPLVVALGVELEVDGWPGAVAPLVSDGMLLSPGGALSLGLLGPLGWALVSLDELDCA